MIEHGLEPIIVHPVQSTARSQQKVLGGLAVMSAAVPVAGFWFARRVSRAPSAVPGTTSAEAEQSNDRKQ